MGRVVWNKSGSTGWKVSELLVSELLVSNLQTGFMLQLGGGTG